MSVHAAPAPGDGLALTIRGRAFPVVLPKLRDPRLHLAATITSLQVIGQVGFHFELSVAQILVALGTCAVLEIAIALWRQGVLLWPASALLTGNGVAFVLRVPHTAHGDWWSLRGWWIFAATAAVALLSKHVLIWRGAHVFNPSNIGLVICFLALGRTRAVPLDFWWGPMSTWLVLALVVILSGGFAILTRLSLLRVALGFWVSFAAAVAILAAAGHAMTARWHLGPVTGFHFWAVLVTSPEVLVFLFFMITDPKTAPAGGRARFVYAVCLGLLGALLIAPTTTEFAAKVALLSSLALVCVAMPLLRLLPVQRARFRLSYAVPLGAAAYAGLLVGMTTTTVSGTVAAARGSSGLPPIHIVASQGVQSQLDPATARMIAADLVKAVPAAAAAPIRLWLEPGTDQGPPLAVAQTAQATYRLSQVGLARWAVAPHAPARQASAARGPGLRGYGLRNVAPAAGLDFRQGSFRYGMSNDYKAMMGGGVCWIDYNGDGRLDLFAVNSYSSADTAAWQSHGGLPRSALYENVGGRFRDVSRRAHADLAVQGDGCVAGDLNGDGRPDLVVTTAQGLDLLWNRGHGRFAEGARRAGLTAPGWYTGAAVADVNGDGRMDLFVAGYSDPNDPVPGSLAGFPTNIAAVRDLLYLNAGRGRFREVGLQAGIEPGAARHGLGAEFFDANGDGRPDLYVANDEDPNELYANVAWPGGAKADPAHLGFRFEERGDAEGVADPFAGMGVAVNGANLFVTNSRREPSALFRRRGGAFANAGPLVDPILGTTFAGWGASFVDTKNSGHPSLLVAAGAIPVTSVARDAEPVRMLAPAGSRFADALGSRGLRLNGRGLAAADVDNDGRMQIAVNTIGGKLVLLRPTGPVGHWLDVKLARFAPGAVVTARLPDGRTLTQAVVAGSSYLSSEDPRVHFGLGAATSVTTLTVRYPWGGESALNDVHADRIVQLAAPPQRRAARAPAGVCTRAGRSVARVWNEAAVVALRTSGVSEPVQARDLLDLATAMQTADRASGGNPTAISYAAYRLLLWRVSYGANLQQTFTSLSSALRAVCGSPATTVTSGSSPAAVGNRVAAAAIAAGRHDGSLEALHYADPSYVPQNQPLVVSQSGSTVHDPTFWQPLALATIAAHGLAAIPAKVQTFVDPQWGRLRGSRATDPGRPPFADPSSPAYARAAVEVIRATSRRAPGLPDASPLAWNAIANALPSRGLQRDLRLYVELNRALNDAAVSVWNAKRVYQSPRPISMIRYLAFAGQLPGIPGLIESRKGKPMVREQGRWVAAVRWTPPAATPASPGWVSERSAFASAASAVLASLTGRSFAAQADRISRAGVANGIETPADASAGRALGVAVAKRLKPLTP